MHAEIIRGWYILMSATLFIFLQLTLNTPKIRCADQWRGTERCRYLIKDKIYIYKLKNLSSRYISICIILSTMFGMVIIQCSVKITSFVILK